MQWSKDREWRTSRPAPPGHQIEVPGASRHCLPFHLLVRVVVPHFIHSPICESPTIPTLTTTFFFFLLLLSCDRFAS